MMNTVCGVADGFMTAIVIRFIIKDYSVAVEMRKSNGLSNLK